MKWKLNKKDLLSKLDKCIEAVLKKMADRNETKKVFIILNRHFYF